jgi:hypothetical protein
VGWPPQLPNQRCLLEFRHLRESFVARMRFIDWRSSIDVGHCHAGFFYAIPGTSCQATLMSPSGTIVRPAITIKVALMWRDAHSRSDSIHNLSQNFVYPFLEFRNVRATPIGLPALRTLVKVVVIYTRQRFESFDYTFLGDSLQQAVAAQTPAKRASLRVREKRRITSTVCSIGR